MKARAFGKKPAPKIVQIERNGVPAPIAKQIDNSLIHKDGPRHLKPIFAKIIHDSDCADTIRTVKGYKVAYLDFYKDMTNVPSAIDELNLVITEMLDFIKAQGDLCWNIEIILPATAMHPQIKILTEKPSTFPNDGLDYKIKAKYEHAPNCFLAILALLDNYPILKKY